LSTKRKHQQLFVVAQNILNSKLGSAQTLHSKYLHKHKHYITSYTMHYISHTLHYTYTRNLLQYTTSYTNIIYI